MSTLNKETPKSFFQLFAEFLDPATSPLRSSNGFVPLNWVINIQKLGCLFFTFVLMVYYNNFSKGCWVYLGLHGSYGLMWVLKDITFPDKSFQRKVGLIEFIMVALILIMYYLMPFMMTSGMADNNPSDERVFVCIMMYTIGIVLMMATDIQKYVRLSLKKGLIDDLLMETNRNTNFFGEMLLYSAFATLVNERICFYMLFFIWSTLFFSRIYLKELSFSKKEGWNKYKSNSYLLLFKIFSSDILNFIFYSGFVIVCYLTFINGGMEATVKLILNKIK